MEEYLEKQAFSLTGNIRSHFVSHLIATAKDHQFDPWLILAIIKVESSFKSHVVSNRGAIGLLQLKTIAAKEVSIKFNEKNVGRHELFNPFINVKIGIQYLSCLRNQVGRDQSRILAAYNAGPTMLKQNAGVSSGYAFKVLRAYRELSKKS
ncbi:MAG: transglycosylase SLT domain-containing protein [Deltaproteobacteria bacterium]|nr:transglycosylase SLT domain-containing protein [Deltaproteobacteria bacterium]